MRWRPIDWSKTDRLIFRCIAAAAVVGLLLALIRLDRDAELPGWWFVPIVVLLQAVYDLGRYRGIQDERARDLTPRAAAHLPHR